MSSNAANGGTARTNERSLSFRFSIVCLVILFLSYTTNGMDRQVFSVLLPGIRKEFGFDLANSGLLSTIFSLGVGAVSIPMGRLIDKTKRKSVLLAGMLVYSLFTFLTVISTGFWDLLIYRTMTGIGEAMQISALFAAVGSYFYKHRGTAVGCVNTGWGMGAIIGPLWGAQLAGTNVENWRLPFMVFAVVGLVCAAVVAFVVPTGFTETKELDTEGNVKIYSNVPTKLFNHNTALIALTAVMCGITAYGLTYLYPTYMQSILKFTPMVSSASVSFLGLGSLLGVVGGLIGDRFGSKKVTIIAWVFYIISAVLLFNVVTKPWQCSILLFVFGACFSGIMYTNHLVMIQRSVQTGMVATAVGVYTTFFFLAGAASGYVLGALVTAIGWGMAGGLEFVIFGALAIIFLSMLRQDQFIPSAKKTEGAD